MLKHKQININSQLLIWKRSKIRKKPIEMFKIRKTINLIGL